MGKKVLIVVIRHEDNEKIININMILNNRIASRWMKTKTILNIDGVNFNNE